MMNLKKIIAVFFILTIFYVPLLAQNNLDSNKNWCINFQLTIINQWHPAFAAKYFNPYTNSLNNAAENNKTSITTTLFLGRKLWKNAAIYFNPEIAGGEGFSNVKGIAGFTNGETFRIGSPKPQLYYARYYFKQYFALKNTTYTNYQKSANQLAQKIPDWHIGIIIGKFCMSDFFDNNNYSHDPRSQFMNWALMSNGAWDYPADTRGYTKGVVIELTKPTWSCRISSVMEPALANGLQLDNKILKAHAETIELEKRWNTKHPTVIRFLYFHNLSQAPNYNTALQQAKLGDSSSIPAFAGLINSGKYGGLKYGFGFNAQKEISNSAGAFLKTSWNDGKTASWAFTEIDQSSSVGINIKCKFLKRMNDEIGIAQVVNGISAQHQAFLNAGFYGFIIGDGKLNYGNELITEIYYLARVTKNISATVNYQLVNHPAYNKDRGLVNVFSLRGHIEF